MINWILKEISRNPERTFGKNELLQKSETDFAFLHKKEFISKVKNRLDNSLISHPVHGRLEVVIMEGKKYGIKPNEPENEPVVLNNEEIVKYKFDSEVFFQALADANGITSHYRNLKNGIYVLGSRRIGDNLCGFVFAGIPKRNDFYLWVSGIKAACGEVKGLIIFVAENNNQRLEVINALLKDKIVVLNIIDNLDRTTLIVDFQEAGNKIFSGDVWLTGAQAKGYDKYSYKTYDHLKIYNKSGPGRNYFIEVNKIEVSIAYSELLFLLYFILELKKGNGGWTCYKRLIDDEVARDQAHVQRAVGEVKKRISGCLSDRGKADFIENDRKGSYRVSTYPDFIEVPDEGEFNKLYEAVRDAVDEEREDRIKKGVLKA